MSRSAEAWPFKPAKTPAFSLEKLKVGERRRSDDLCGSVRVGRLVDWFGFLLFFLGVQCDIPSPNFIADHCGLTEGMVGDSFLSGGGNLGSLSNQVTQEAATDIMIAMRGRWLA